MYTIFSGIQDEGTGLLQYVKYTVLLILATLLLQTVIIKLEGMKTKHIF